MEIKGLVFDCDGTLIDSMPAHWCAWQEVAHKYGFEFSETRFYSLGGVPSWKILKMVKEEQGLSFDHHQAAHFKEEAFIPFQDKVRPVEPVLDIVKANFGQLPMSIATGGIRSIIEPILNKLDIIKYFEAIVTSEDVVHQKPAPDIFLEAARRIGIAPEHCRAYEDTDLGVQAIKAAGMSCVDIRSMTSR